MPSYLNNSTSLSVS